MVPTRTLAKSGRYESRTGADGLKPTPELVLYQQVFADDGSYIMVPRSQIPTYIQRIVKTDYDTRGSILFYFPNVLHLLFLFFFLGGAGKQ